MKIKRSGGIIGSITPTSTGKGKHTRVKKYENEIKNHINSYRPYVSHHRLTNSLNRRYLDSDMCMMDLYKNCKEKYGESAAGIETYRKIFLAENIGFSQPSADECEQCLEYKVHTEEVTHAEEDLGECKICSNFPRHKQKYRESRHEYTKGK